VAAGAFYGLVGLGGATIAALFAAMPRELIVGLAGIALLAIPGKPGYALGWLLAVAGLLMQVLGMVLRVLVSGRAPVTNMYESVIWVAFGTILFALIFEGIHRSRYFLLGAVPVAVASLILADTQPVILDRSIHPLVPVLMDNFWLTTHVLTITLSYAAFALALGVGHIILGKSLFGSKASPALHNYLYRSIQIGVLLLAVGTVLGAVWANYSWGRFWDWDPKETWALVALLSYLFLLHGRIAGTWGGFGMAVGALFARAAAVLLNEPARREAMVRRIAELGLTNGVGEAVAALRALARRGAKLDGTVAAAAGSVRGQ
jgi:ABC-type transport system involved in cytochrome c biogenesis permease subunit